jgi:hypothetical protein
VYCQNNKFAHLSNAHAENAITRYIAANYAILRFCREQYMNLDKSKKRIAKRAKMGFQGYPKISLTYYGKTAGHADEVVVEFVLEEGAEIQTERFSSKIDAREDEVIQSALVKMIERSEAKTVCQIEGVSVVV